ncbi:MAG: acetyltransferase [Saprospiraceae bacterium]|nr:acetyltransferase [Saprospiraceae bacterium]
MKRLAIIGSGDLGLLIAHHASQSGEFIVVGFYNDFLEKGTSVKSYSILGGIEDVQTDFEMDKFDFLMIGVGYQHFGFRKKSFERFKSKIPFANIIHSSAYIDPSCRLGEGIFILPGCVLDHGVELADNVLLNTACSIAHDSKVGAHSFLSPRVAMAGFIEIGECCNIGINSTIIDNIKIVDHVQTGGGTVVVKNLNQAGLYVGVPARFVR